MRFRRSGLQSLCENSESERFCSARLLSGHSSYRHDPQCPLKRRALQNRSDSEFSQTLQPLKLQGLKASHMPC